MPISTVQILTKIRLTMLCLSGFELYSRWVPLSRGGGTPHIEGVGMLVGNFELNP